MSRFFIVIYLSDKKTNLPEADILKPTQKQKNINLDSKLENNFNSTSFTSNFLLRILNIYSCMCNAGPSYSTTA